MPASHSSGTYAQNPQRSRSRAPNRSQGTGNIRPGMRRSGPQVVTGAAPFLPPGVRPAAPVAPAPAAAPAPPPDPRDASYYEDIAGIRGTREGLYADLARDEKYAAQDRDDALKQLVKARADSLMNAKNAANARGLFYSSFLTNQNADIGTDFNNRDTSVHNTYDRSHADRESARANLQRTYGDSGSLGFGTEGQRLLREAIDRQAGRDVAAPPPAVNFALPQSQAQTVDTSATSAGDTSRGGWGSGGLSETELIRQALRHKRQKSHTGVL